MLQAYRDPSRPAGRALMFGLAALSALSLSALVPSGEARAQDSWPERPVTLVVPFNAGGTSDILARIVAQQLSGELGQNVVVENQPGAGGSVGTAAVARAEPDGYTLLLGTVGTHSINESLYPTLGYDPVADFAPVTPIAAVPNVLVAHPSEPYDSVEELVAYAHAHPGEILFASSGAGTSIHLSGEMFRVIADVEMEHVPYTGSGPAVAALLGNETAIMFDNLPSSIQQIRSGALKALAVTTAERAEALPDVPTIAESGFPDYEATSWFGIFAPDGTPQPVIERLHGAIVDLLSRDDVREQFALQGAVARTDTPEGFASFMEAERTKWADIIESAGVTIN